MAKRVIVDAEPTGPNGKPVEGASATATAAPAASAPNTSSKSESAGSDKKTAKPTKAKGKPKSKGKPKQKERSYIQRPFPQRTLEVALKVPTVIKEKNNGNPMATTDVGNACGYTNVKSSGFQYLTYAARDYGLTTGTFTTEKIELAELGRKVVYPPNSEAERQSKIQAFFKVNIFKKVFDHYGGSKLPEQTYLSNTLTNDFGLINKIHDEFVTVFKANCKYLDIENGLREGESAVVQAKAQEANEHADIRVVGQAKGKFDRTAFVIMPFSEKNIVEKRPSGFFLEVLNTLITQAANEAGFAVETAEQHGSDVIQSTILNRLLKADLVIADITDHNPNVMFELGIRMAKEKPVQLIRAEGTPRIFDVDNMLRVFSYNPNLWATTVQTDRPRLADHIKATWDNKTVNRSYIQILTGGVPASEPVTAAT
jgi:hypothetical protein